MQEPQGTHSRNLDSVWGTYPRPTSTTNHISQTTNAQAHNFSSQTLRPILPKRNDIDGQALPSTGTTCYSIDSILNPSNSTPSQIVNSKTPHLPTNQLAIVDQSTAPNTYTTNIIPTNASTSPDRWHQAREYRRMVHQPPYINPRTDRTIANIEANAEFWVSQLMRSMLNTICVKDRDSSHAKRVFLPGGYDPLLIESACREIFLSLLDRCRSGFRGPPSFNKALKPGRELDADRSATCQERLQNVVRVLMWNKRACKDVLYEDWKIRLLVNHPLAYDKEKDSQKESNDQRRVRQVEEREKLRCTEAELREYQHVADAGAGTIQFHAPQWNGEKRRRKEECAVYEGIDPKKMRLGHQEMHTERAAV